MSKEISQAVIRRLPRYYRYLGELLDEGVERISSNDLSHRMKVTASQIRQDLNNFGGFGQQGYGYNVQFLYEEIGKIMGLDTEHRIIIIGAGNLGQALANYVKFEKLGFVITALFDVNPELSGKSVRGIPILMLNELGEYCRAHLNQGNFASVDMSKFGEFVFFLPDIDRQHEIADILERFDTLCNDLSSGLPAEIAARQKQYEYYRDKLLSFEEVKA